MIFPGTQKGSGSGEDNLNPLLPKPFAFQGFFNRKKIKVRNHLYQRLRTFVVEMAGVEPASESTLTGTSPGADGYLYSLASAGAVTLESSVASLFMVRSKLCARTCTTCRRSVPGRGPPGGNAR